MMKRVNTSILLLCALLLCAALLPTAALAKSPKAPVYSLAAGDDHSLYADGGYGLYAWGGNRYGQLGTGDREDCTTATRVLEELKIVQVAAGSRHSLALTADGDLYACGDNTYGQCGAEIAVCYEGPEVQYPNTGDWKFIMSGVKQISAGSLHSVVLTDNGDVYTFGYNKAAALGTGDLENAVFRVKVLSGAKYVEAGGNASFAILENGDLYAWGYGKYYALGNGSNKSILTPKKVASDVAVVSTSGRHTLVLKENGRLYGCGQNEHGQLADDDTDEPVKKLTRIAKNVKSASAGWNASAYIAENGDLYACGQLALQEYYTEDRPWIGTDDDVVDTGYDVYEWTKLAKDVQTVSYGDYHCVFASEDGSVYAFGHNGWTQLGQGDYKQHEGIEEVNLDAEDAETPGIPKELASIRNITAIEEQPTDFYRNAKEYRLSLADGSRITAIVYETSADLMADFAEEKLDFVITDDLMQDYVTGESSGRHGPYMIGDCVIADFSEASVHSYQRTAAMIKDGGWQSVWGMYTAE